MSEKGARKIMLTKKRVGHVMWAALMLGLLSPATWANDKNFKAAAGQSGCASIITKDGIRACKAVQEAKNTACNRPSSCELDKQEQWAKDYGELYKWWDEGGDNAGKNLPDNDFKRDKQRQMRELVDRLQIGRTSATAGATLANECIQARTAVQNWFENVAIPLTGRTKDELLPIRRALVDKFNETKAKREDAKKK
ncbi:MAG: hypothetical protein ABI704_05470 [Kofleriaceae bacterium]